MAEKPAQVYYAAGWKPEPYTPREESWADTSVHAKISDYRVVRNDANAYSWSFELHVSDKEYKLAWKGEADKVVASIEDGCLVLKNPEEETGAYLKLPKAANASATPTIDAPPRGGFFVTLAKTGAKAAPTPLSEDILGTGPIVQMDRAPPLEEELERIGREQRERAAKAA